MRKLISSQNLQRNIYKREMISTNKQNTQNLLRSTKRLKEEIPNLLRFTQIKLLVILS